MGDGMHTFGVLRVVWRAERAFKVAGGAASSSGVRILELSVFPNRLTAASAAADGQTRNFTHRIHSRGKADIEVRVPGWRGRSRL